MKKKLSILDMVIDTFKNTPIDTEFSRSEIVNLVTSKFGCNPTSVIPSDYCYNRLNNGIDYEKYLHFMKRDNFKCVLCGASPAKDPKIELHIDHIIPWSKGGESTIDNLQTLCSACNLGKRDSV